MLTFLQSDRYCPRIESAKCSFHLLEILFLFDLLTLKLKIFYEIGFQNIFPAEASQADRGPEPATGGLLSLLQHSRRLLLHPPHPHGQHADVLHVLRVLQAVVLVQGGQGRGEDQDCDLVLRHSSLHFRCFRG